jgi:hypothetical protein
MKQTGHFLSRLFLLYLPFAAPFSYMIWTWYCKVAAKRKNPQSIFPKRQNGWFPSGLLFFQSSRIREEMAAWS